MELKTDAFQEAKAVPTPETEKVITVKTRKGGLTIDGKNIPEDMTIKVSVKQWRALSRSLEWVDGPNEHDPANKTFINKAKKAAAAPAALIVFLLTLLAAPRAQALTNTLAFPNAYGLFTSCVLSSNYITPVSGSAVAPLFITNGQGSNSLALTTFDSVSLQFGWQPVTNLAGTSGITNYLIISGSDDGYNFATNSALVTWGPLVEGPGTNTAWFVTNLNNLILGSTGYIDVILSNVSGSTTGSEIIPTNFVFKVVGKPIRAGR